MTSQERNLKRRYGISLDQYNQLLDAQNGRCGICEKHHSEFKTNLAVDHDHISGAIRGLACSYCNHRLIGRHRDPELLRKIADWVERTTGWFVPPRPVRRRTLRKKK